MPSKIIGAILLIVGTSIGAGMLALPIANAANGFWGSSIYLLACWCLTTIGALYLLEVTLYLKAGSHMLSMAKATLGRPGLFIAWFSYLTLLYTLLCAYIAGGTDVLSGLLKQIHINIPDAVLSSLFTFIFATVVCSGIRQVDLLNRGLMFAKLFIYVSLLLFIAPNVQIPPINQTHWPVSADTLMILITSFGFAIIIPNLRDYFFNQTQHLHRIVLIGSLIPLLCYLAWDAAIMGSLSHTQADALLNLNHLPHPTTGLAQLLSQTLLNAKIHSLFNLFSSICMLTAFLAVSLALHGFLKDGLKLSGPGAERYILFFTTFIPPLLINIFIPGLYLHALAYAGIICVILLIIMPAMMSYCGRSQFKPIWSVPGGIYLQILTILIGFILLTFALTKLIIN